MFKEFKAWHLVLVIISCIGVGSILTSKACTSTPEERKEKAAQLATEAANRSYATQKREAWIKECEGHPAQLCRWTFVYNSDGTRGWDRETQKYITRYECHEGTYTELHEQCAETYDKTH